MCEPGAFRKSTPLIAPEWDVGFLVAHTIISSLMGLPVGAFLYFALRYVFKRPSEESDRSSH